jgi:hypothetical protein
MVRAGISQRTRSAAGEEAGVRKPSRPHNEAMSFARRVGPTVTGLDRRCPTIATAVDADVTNGQMR